MKLTPLFIFLILLFVLVISVIFSNWLPLYNSSEGFISQYTTKKPLERINIPQYSTKNNVTKLYDNLFLDPDNGNLIEANGIDTPRPDASGTDIWVITTDLSNVNKTIETHYPNEIVDYTKESKYLYKNSNKYWSYTTQCVKTDKYQVFYINWVDIRFLHIINLTTSKNTYSYILDNGGLSTIKMIDIEIPTASNTNLDISNPTLKNYTSTLYTKSHTNAVVFSISGDYIHYDSINKTIILIDDSSTAILYNAGGDDTLSSSLSFRTTMIYDKNTKQIVLSTIYKDITIIVLISYTTTTTTTTPTIIYNIKNVFRFDSKGNFSEGTKTGNSNDLKHDLNDTPKDDDDDDDSTDLSGSKISEYYKWYWYWKTANTPDSISDDYILKTQIVPPVCPSCPSCPSCNGVCTNCGGNGGSGTLTDSINNMGSALNKNANAIGSGIYNAGTGLGSALNKDANAIGSGIYNAGTGLGSALNKDANAIGSGIYNAGTGLGSALNQNANAIGSGIYNAGTGLGSALNKDANAIGSGIYNAGTGLGSALNQNANAGTGLGSALNQNANNAAGQYTAVNSGIDVYSAYGALSSKGGNFIPITNSFAAFGK